MPAEWHAWLHYTVDKPLPTPEDKPWVKALIESYHTPEVRDFVLTKFKGAVLPTW